MLRLIKHVIAIKAHALQTFTGNCIVQTEDLRE